jgi:chemotaxis protein histidine kinase CheA
MSESKTSERRLKAAERQREALQLRAAGRTFEDIAKELGYRGPSGAYRAVQAGLKKTLQEPADELRRVECERLDRLMEALWERAIVRGNVAAVDRVLRIMERRSRLLGLDAPSRLQLEGFWHSADGQLIKTTITAALQDFPEARESVIGALRKLGGSDD